MIWGAVGGAHGTLQNKTSIAVYEIMARQNINIIIDLLTEGRKELTAKCDC